MTDSQHCPKCAQDLPRTSFHRDSSKKTGLKAICKACDKTLFYAKRNDARKTKQGRAARSDWNRNREFSEDKQAREKKHAAKYRERYPEKAAAKRAVRSAIKSGQLQRPDACTTCGSNPGVGRDGRPLIHAHHDDYSRSLDVRWLCLSCHTTHHRALSRSPVTDGAATDPDLVQRCQELLQWSKTGLLAGGDGGLIRALATKLEATVGPNYALSVAESQTKDDAMREVVRLASGGVA